MIVIHRCNDVPHESTLFVGLPMNELEYDELKSYLRKGDFWLRASKIVRFKLRRLEKNFEYDPAIASFMMLTRRTIKNGLLSTAPSSTAPSTTASSTNSGLNKSQGKKLTMTNTDNQP